MSEPQERRQARRVDIRIPVSFRGPDGSQKSGTTANVSRRGMLILAHDSFRAGTPLRVAVTGADGREREIAGEIVRTSTDALAISLDDEAAVLQGIIEAETSSPSE